MSKSRFAAISVAGAAAFLILGSLANAADLSPVYKAPPAPPPAIPQASGYVEIYGGGSWLKLSDAFSEEKLDGLPLGGAGRGTYWFSPNWSVQVDAQGEGTQYRFTDGSVGHVSATSTLVGAHLNWRHQQTGLIGVFAAAGDAGGGFSPAERHFVFGGEGQYYLNMLTLYLQGGYDRTAGALDPERDNIHAWFIRGTGRYFLMPNLMAEGTVLYAAGATDFTPNPFVDSQGFNTWLWHAKLEWRFPNIPFSVFAKYQGSETRYDNVTGFFTNDARVTDNRFLVGARLYMGQGTLLSNDRTGSTLDIIDPLGSPTSPLSLPFFGTTTMMN